MNIFIIVQLKSYEVHRSSILDKGFPQDAEKGYSLYYYESDKPSKYCILGEENLYEMERIYLGVVISCLLVFIAFSSPLILYMIFNKKTLEERDTADKGKKGGAVNTTSTADGEDVRSKGNKSDKVTEKVPGKKENKMKKSKNIRYFLWSIVVTSFILVVLICVINILIFETNINYYPNNSSSEGNYMYFIFILYCTAFVGLAVCFILSGVLIGITLAIIRRNRFDKPIKDIPIPIPFRIFVEKCLCCCRKPDSDHQKHEICAESVALFLGTFILTMFLQLSGFHIFFIILGVLATPIYSISMFCFYMAFTFLTIAFIAILLKMSNTKKVFAWIIAFLIGFVGLAGLVMLMFFYYNYINSVDDNTYHSALTLLGRILPAAIAALLAFFGKNMLSYIKDGGFTSSQNTKSPSSSPKVTKNKGGEISSKEQEDNKPKVQGGATSHGITVLEEHVET